MTRQSVEVAEYIEGLRAMESDYITLDRVFEYCATRRLDDEALKRHVIFKQERYTRHLLYRDDLFEVMLIGWIPGQKTPAHSHNGQLGWMTVERGAIDVQNFRYLSCSTPERQNVVGLDCLGGGENIKLDPLATVHANQASDVQTVDKLQTIHRLECPSDCDENTISLHIYSRPFTSCVTFDLEQGRCGRRQLFWDTEYGRAVAGSPS